jgi:hypothetical protein
MNMLSLQVVLVLAASLAGLCCVDAALACLRSPLRAWRGSNLACAAVMACLTGALLGTVFGLSRLGGAA